jgi:hypothetical protein
MNTFAQLPDDVIYCIMSHYKAGLHERMPPTAFVGQGRTYCEVCDRNKRRVLWFSTSFPNPVDNRPVYSACPECSKHAHRRYRML